MKAVIYARYSSDNQRKNPLMARFENVLLLRRKRYHDSAPLH